MTGIATSAILTALRRELRRQDIRVADLATRAGVAEPTLWRWLRGQGLTLDRLDRLCTAMGIDLRDLAAEARGGGEDRFTLAQERVLAADRGLALIFFSLLHGATRDLWLREFGMPETRIDAHVQRLHRLGLIDIGAGGRLQPRVSRDVRWRAGGPLAIAFDRNVKQFFLSGDFGATDARYVSEMVRLTETGRARVHALMEGLRGEINLIATQEAAAHGANPDWSGVLMLVRQLDIDAITRDLR